jgi:hypothetical protein
MICPICKGEFTHSCRRTVASQSGKVRSEAKRQAAVRNMALARQARLEKYQANQALKISETVD